ncbi:Ldh family oxidoreductase [Pelagibius sp. CAU 1746]|uniref:Ldh family oxidoreductase n=1 Tax=Pelagibius sp. CAU 1746 TaxID=3140370 RepID=UPI00325A6D01
MSAADEEQQQDREPAARVAAADLDRFVRAVLAAAGADEVSAEATARALVGASLRGVDSHGVRLLPHYAKVVEGGRVKGRPEMRFEKTAAAAGRLDAGHALGTAAGYRAMEEAVKLAEDAGLGAVSVSNSSHFAAAGCYTLAAAEAGYIGLSTCNATSAVLAHSGRAGFHGTNPISFAVPVAGERPYLIDMASSSIPVNRILQYRALDRELPAEVVVDDGGRMTRDPHAAKSLLPLGGSGYGYKGAALAGMVEILSAGLSGMCLSHQMAEMFQPPWSEPRRLGQFFLALKPSAFVAEEVFQAQLRDYLDSLRGQAALPGERVMAAGDREWAVERHRSTEGIPLDAHNWRLFGEEAAARGIAPLSAL